MRESPRKKREEQFRTLYEANYARILGYALRRTDSAEDAADIVADTFTTAWRRFEEMPRGDQAALWLYGVARRILANHHRKEASRSVVLEILARDLRGYEEAWLDPLPTHGSALAEAWMALRLEDRDLLGLVVWETLTTHEIAAVIGCPRTVAKVRLHRARGRFARELTRRGVDVKPAKLTRHVQVGRADALPDTEAM